jgi:hypothetical protein
MRHFFELRCINIDIIIQGYRKIQKSIKFPRPRLKPKLSQHATENRSRKAPWD